MKIILIINLVLALFSFSPLHAKISKKDLQYIIPQGDTFIYKKEKYNYYEVYSKKELIGFCYITTEILTNSNGYNGPLHLLVGLSKNEKLFGIKVMKHSENIDPANKIKTKKFEQQFKNKKITDTFLVGKDIDNITGATITVDRLSSIVKVSANLLYQYYFHKKSYTTDIKKEELILKPKWKIEKVDRSLFKNNSLSTQEAQFYQKVPK